MIPENKDYNISITITDENGLAQALVIIETVQEENFEYNINNINNYRNYLFIIKRKND